MFSSARLLALVSLTALLAESRLPGRTVLDGSRFASPSGPKPDLTHPNTDNAAILEAISQVDQAQGTSSAIQTSSLPKTTIIARDGLFDAEPIPGLASQVVPRRVPGKLARRSSEGYELVFQGTGTHAGAVDASIQGIAFLTSTTIPNSTYNHLACLDFCDSIPGCVFTNLFYEFNNPELDAASNVKCAVFAEHHTAARKTDRGGRIMKAGCEPTYVKHSSGWSKRAVAAEPAVPEGYELAWGPLNAAANAPGYTGFAFLSQYDVNACAQLCNTRGEDNVGGRCVFFNIWRAVVNGTPTTYTCSMYWVTAPVSTAVNTGQGNLQVTLSRGYTRKNYVIDGSFEGYIGDGSSLSFTESYTNWAASSPAGGLLDATFFFNPLFARTGHSLAILGSADGQDNLSGTITPKKALKTVAGKKYTLQFYHNSAFNGELELGAFVDVLWNGVTIQTIRPGTSPWTRFEIKLPAAKGNDVIAFRGGAFPAYSFLDDISILIGQA